MNACMCVCVCLYVTRRKMHECKHVFIGETELIKREIFKPKLKPLRCRECETNIHTCMIYNYIVICIYTDCIHTAIYICVFRDNFVVISLAAADLHTHTHKHTRLYTYSCVLQYWPTWKSWNNLEPEIISFILISHAPILSMLLSFIDRY